MSALSAKATAMIEGMKARGATNTELVIVCLLIPFLDLEPAKRALLTRRNVNTAVGVWLDVIGKIVGRRRQGVTDDDEYRRYVRSQISANKSNGNIVDLIRVARMVVYDDGARYVFRNTGNAAYEFYVDEISLPDNAVRPLVRQMLKATAAGVRALIAWADDIDAALYWDDGNWDDNEWWFATDRNV